MLVLALILDIDFENLNLVFCFFLLECLLNLDFLSLLFSQLELVNSDSKTEFKSELAAFDVVDSFMFVSIFVFSSASVCVC